MDDNPTMWKSLPSVFGILATVSLVLSITYDWGYLHWLGVSFSEVPTSLSDHARSALVWAPSVGIGFFCFFVLELLTRRIEQGMTEQELIETSKNPKFTKLYREAPLILGEVFAVGGVVAYLLWAAIPLEVFFVLSVISWFVIARWLFSHKRIQERTSPIYRIGIALIPAVFIYFVNTGMSAAKTDVSKARAESFRTIKIKTQAKPFEAKVLRNFEKAVLLWDPVQMKIRLIPWNEIDSIVFPYHESTFAGLLAEKESGKNEKAKKSNNEK